MPYIEETYSQQKIDNLFQYLQSSKEQGEAEDYEIFVDSFKVVKRTNDVSRFESYANYIQPQTKTLTILIYDGTSPRNTKHVFKLKEDEKQTLSGLDIDNRITEKLQTEKEKWETELLKKEHETLKADLEQAHNYIDELEEKLELTKDKKFRMGDINVGEFASVVLEGIVRRNPQMLAKLPGGEALAGVFIEDNEEKQKLLNAAPEAEPKVSFKMKGEENTENALSEEDKASLGFIKQLNEVFNREQMTNVMLILDVLAKTPDDIEKTIQFLSDLHKQ